MRAPLSRPALPRLGTPGLALLVAISLAGCSETSPGSLDGEVPVLDLREPAVRFGSLDDPESSLVPVSHLALAPDGSVWAAQGQDGQLLVVAQDGTPLSRVGGLGEGPGEFGGIQGLGWVGDTLWVTDNRNDRVTFVDGDGRLIGSMPRPRTEVGDDATASFTGLLLDGALFTGGPSLAVLTDPNTPTSGDDPVLWTARDGTTARPIAVRSGTRLQVVVTEMAGGEIRSISVFRQPWSDGSLVAIAPGGRSIAVVDRRLPDEGEPTAFRVTRIGIAGDTVWSTTRPYSPVEADRTRQDSVLARYAENGPSLEALEEVIFRPTIQPPASSVFVGRDGRTWVGRESPADSGTGEGSAAGAKRRWDVFGSDGQLVAIFNVPVAIELLAADGAVAWGVETDDLDVPYLVRLDLPNE
jgi:hypothetical protein